MGVVRTESSEEVQTVRGVVEVAAPCAGLVMVEVSVCCSCRLVEEVGSHQKVLPVLPF